MTSVTPKQHQTQSPSTTTEQQSNPSPKDLKSSVPQSHQKLARQTKRQRPPTATKPTTKPPIHHRHHLVTVPATNFITSVSEFPPLVSSKASTATAAATAPIKLPIREGSLTSGHPLHSSKTTVSLTTIPKLLLKKPTCDTGTNGRHDVRPRNSFSLQPTAREFHPPLSRSEYPTLPSTNKTTGSTTSTLSRTDVVPTQQSNVPPLVQKATTTTPTHQPHPPIPTLKAHENQIKKLSKKLVASSRSPPTKDTKANESSPKPATNTTKLKAVNIRQETADSKLTDRQEELGSQFDLLRLYQTGKMNIAQPANGGQFIQRITPKKKKFSSLKKKVLEERLRQWQTANGIIPEGDTVESQSQVPSQMSTATTVCLYGFAYEIDVAEDDDEYDELMDHLRDMASKFGPIRRIFIPRNETTEKFHRNGNWPAFVEFGTDSTPDDATKPHKYDAAAAAAAQAAVQCWSTLVLGGQTLSCRLLLPMEQQTCGTTTVPDTSETSQQVVDDEVQWRKHCLAVESSWTDPVVASSSDAIIKPSIRCEVLLHDILTDDDLDDDDCLEESLKDIRMVASKYGEVESVIAVRNEDDKLSTNVFITYSCDASTAILELNKVVFGGQPIVATLVSSSSSSKSGFIVTLRNIITDDDLEDESCLEESLNDVKELATQYGMVQDVTVDRPEDQSKLSQCGEYAMQIHFPTIHEAQDARKGFDGMLVGGQTITATMDGTMIDQAMSSIENLTSTNDNSEPSPMYSGDKLISERFAECKRAPKIVNANVTPRFYAKLVDDDSIKPTIIEMLSELMRLQRRAMEENNVKAKRRLVMGLREVARGIRSHKVKLVIMANNLDEYGVIDKTVQDIIDLAKAEEVPIYYELNKKGLGKAVGKSIKVAVVGVQSADGAHQQYKKLVNYAIRNF